MNVTILLVEDSPTVSNLLSMGLGQQGYNVLTAADGLEGLGTLAEHRVDLIIADVNMPRMDGITFVGAVRRRPDFEKVPIVILSTECRDKDRRLGLSAGADLYLCKPIKAKDLADHLSALLASGRAPDPYPSQATA